MQLPIYPGPRLEMAVERSSAALATLIEAARNLLAESPALLAETAVKRGFFRPQEDEVLALWFARFLTVRDGLWEVLSDLIAAREGQIEDFFNVAEPFKEAAARSSDSDVEALLEWQAFVLGYGAACAVVRLDRFLIEELAVHTLVQRKLNQGFPELRIPRKLYTTIFDSFTDPSSALVLDRAISVRRRLGSRIERSRVDALLEPVIASLPWLETSLDQSRRRFLGLLARFQSHALRRRVATIRDHGLFSLLESSGRLASEIRDRWRQPRLRDQVLDRIAALLRPGDVLITRHERALTNLFLPGFWPHAALHVGTEEDRQRLKVELDAKHERLWCGPNRVLEALKDGVRFRPLAETLHVDAAVVIRPALSQMAIAQGLARAAQHEGKGYNFDFDFFRSDRLVCTEVVYRAFDGLEDFELQLKERGGRPTLAAEDLLDLALDTDHFEVVALIGAPPEPDTLYLGADAIEPLRRSYRDSTS